MSLICRTCMQLNKKCVNIFDHHENGKLLSEMLEEYARIKVQVNDGLPLNICNCCLEKLTIAWEFRVVIIEADSILRYFINKRVKENVQQSNNSFINMTIVKEESSIVKSEVSSSLIPENMHVSNCSKLKCPLERIASANIDIYANFLGNTNKQEDTDKTLAKTIANEDNSIKSIHISTGENDTMIPEKTTKNFAKKGGGTSLSSETHSALENACNSKQNATSNLLNPEDCSAEKLSARNYVSCENNTVKKIEKLETKKQDYLIQDTCKESNLIDHENEDDMLENNSYESINNSDISTGNTVEVELSSEKVNKKLTKKEKNRMSVFCKPCNRSFGYRYYFEIHVKDHNGDKKCKCSVCGKAFVRQFQLRLHMTKHSDDRPFSCETCGKTFKYQGQLHSHKALHSDDTQHACSICQKTFKTKNLLRAHLQRHRNEKKFTCEVCGKSFSDPSAFCKHRLTHVDGKKFPCLTCGKTFLSSSHMRSHLRVHSEARPYSCNYCGKSFKTKDVMDTHILIHTGEKPYSCKLCDKLFRQPSALYNHMRIHTGETPYACKLCQSQFKYSHHLQKHMKVHK